MKPELINFVKKIITKNGIASFAAILFLFTFFAGFVLIAGIAKAQSAEDLLPAILVFSSGVAATAFFYSLAAILNRQNIISLMLLVQHNPEEQDELIELIELRTGKKVKSKVK